MCPHCRSDRLRIRQLTGLERLMVFFTRMRKYRCRDCHLSFRLADRRSTSRSKLPSEDRVIPRNLI